MAQSSALRPQARLKRRADFRRVQTTGARAHTTHFVVLVHPSPTGMGRLGVTVTKKVGGAVQRNRIKRLVREVFRRQRNDFPADCDVVLIAKRNIPQDLDFATVSAELARARGAMRRARSKALKSPST